MWAKMYVKAFAIPMILVAATLIVDFIFGWFIPHQLGHIGILASVGERSPQLAPYLVSVLAFFAALATLVQTWRLIRWKTGHAVACQQCGGYTVVKVGGRQRQCLACGLVVDEKQGQMNRGMSP
jgi:hypothetical protein